LQLPDIPSGKRLFCIDGDFEQHKNTHRKKKGKKMKKKLTFIGLSLLLAVSLTSLVVTQAAARWKNRSGGQMNCCNLGAGQGGGGCGMGNMGPGGMGKGPGPMGPESFARIGRYVDLSIDQRQEMHKLRFDFAKKNLNFEDELGQKRLERRALLEKDPVEWKKVDRLTDEMAMIEANMEKQRMRQRLEIKKILTPEQLEKLNNLQCGQGADGPGAPPEKGFGCGFGPGKGKGPGKGMGMGG
jgi:Spy/CpxP family protein refolding chaperone